MAIFEIPYHLLMKSYADKNQEQTVRHSKNKSPDRQSPLSDSGWADHRAEAVTQRKLQAIADESPQVQALSRWDSIANPLSVQEKNGSAPLKEQRETGSGKPVQRVTAELKQQGITNPMEQRWDAAYAKMKSVVDTSAFGNSNKHSVLLWAASSGSLQSIKNAYAATSLYVSKLATTSGYTSGDYASFDEVALPFDFSQKTTHAYRIVITFNLTRNATVEEIYTTFLHEWHIHALPWINTAIAGLNVAGKNSDREKDEHKTYANKTDNELEVYVNGLGLGNVQKATVLSKLKNDRDRYDKNSGDIK